MSNAPWRSTTWRLLLVLVLALPANPCGPFYDDAHHGYDDPYRVCLEDFYYSLYYPGDTLPARHARGIAAFAQAKEHEQARDFTQALVSYRTALRELNGFSGDYATINTAQDNIDLFASLPETYDVNLVLDYIDARDKGDLEKMAALRDGKSLVSDNAAFHLARMAFDFAGTQSRTDFVDAALVLFNDLATDHPGSEKSDAAAYRAARCRLEILKRDPLQISADAVRAAFQAYLDRFPLGRYRAEAIGWKAWLIQRADKRAGNHDHAAEAIRLYLRLLDQPELHGMFIAAVESLRFAYRDVRADPPDLVLADPRHAAAFLFHAVTDHGVDFPPASTPALRAVLKRAQPANLAATALPPEVKARLGRAYYLIGDAATARGLAEAALAVRRDADALHLLGRCQADAGQLGEADQTLDELQRNHPLFTGVRELALRLGADYEHAGRPADALRVYAQADSTMDLAIISDGEIGVDEFKAFVDAHPTLVVPVRPIFAWQQQAIAKGASEDLMPMLRERLGVRLARVGRYVEAMPYLPAERKAKVNEAWLCEAAVAAATPENRPAALYALAAFWYKDGKHVLFNGAEWHQFYMGGANIAQDVKLFPDHAAMWKAREANLLAMTGYVRARALFLEIVDKYPKSPEAPKALYSAASCYYWLCGQTYLKTCDYWLEKSRSDEYWNHGKELILRLVNDFPDHPLAKSEWTLKVLAGTAVPHK